MNPAIAFSVFGILIALASLSRPALAVAFFVASFSIESFLQSQSEFFVRNSFFVNVWAGIIAAVAFTSEQIKTRFRSLNLSQTQVLAITLYLFAIASFLWSPYPEIANAFEKEWPYLIVFLLILPALCRNGNSPKQFAEWYILFMVPTLLASIFMAKWGSRGMLLAAPIYSTVDGGKIIETPPLALSLASSNLAIVALFHDSGRRFWPVIRVACFFLGLYTTFLSQARGQTVVLFVMSLIYMSSGRSQARDNAALPRLLLLGSFLATLLVASYTLALSRWQSERIESAFAGRRSMIETSLAYWFDDLPSSAIRGLGMGASYIFNGTYCHNLYVEVLTELGLPGLFLIALATIRPIANFAKLKGDSQIQGSGNSVMVFGFLVCSGLLSLKQGTLVSWPSLFFFAAWLEHLNQTSFQRSRWHEIVRHRPS
jgi:hypothetical protein